MTPYEEKVQELYDKGITVIELDPSDRISDKIKGLCIGSDLIWIRPDMTTNEKYCVLCEEEAHIRLTEGNIIDIHNINNRKQEFKARAQVYMKLITKEKIQKAIDNGCTSCYELANDLGVSESFVTEALYYYKNNQKLGENIL